MAAVYILLQGEYLLVAVAEYTLLQSEYLLVAVPLYAFPLNGRVVSATRVVVARQRRLIPFLLRLMRLLRALA